jgi:hypothetical protein
MELNVPEEEEGKVEEHFHCYCHTREGMGQKICLCQNLGDEGFDVPVIAVEHE